MAAPRKRGRSRMDSCMSTDTQTTTVSSTSDDVQTDGPLESPTYDDGRRLSGSDETFHFLGDLRKCMNASEDRLNQKDEQTGRKQVYSGETIKQVYSGETNTDRENRDKRRRRQLRQSARKSISQTDVSSHIYNSLLSERQNSRAEQADGGRPVSFTIDDERIVGHIAERNIGHRRELAKRERRHTEGEMDVRDLRINQPSLHHSQTTSALLTIRVENSGTNQGAPLSPRSPTPIDTTVSINPSGTPETRIIPRSTSGTSSPNNSAATPPIGTTYIEQDPVCCKCCRYNLSYKKVFYIMCFINIIMFLINAVGLPFLYIVMTRLPEVEATHPPTQTTPLSLIKELPASCRSCDDVEYNASDLEGRQCCVNKVADVVKVTKGVIEEEVSSMSRNFIHSEASTANNNTGVLAIKVIAKNGIQHYDGHLNVTKPGYYFIYSRVSFRRKTSQEKNERKFSISYFVKLNDGETIDSEIQMCFANDVTQAVEHTLSSQTVKFLQKGDRISIQVRDDTYLSTDGPTHRLGMFLLAS